MLRTTIPARFLGLAAFCLAGAALAQAPRASAEPVVVTLASEAVVDDSIVDLSQIASLAGGPDALRQRLSRLDVVEFRLDTPQLVIGREQVRFRLLMAGVDERAIVFRGAARVFVKETSVPVSFRKVALVAEQTLREQYAAPMVMTMQRALEVPALTPRAGERCRLSGKIKSAPERTGFALVDVTIALNGKTCAVVPVSVEISERTKTPPLDSFEKTGIRPALHTAPASALDEPFAVKARDNVKITARIGTARIEALGEALQDGRVGDVIRIRNSESGRTVHGRIEQGGLIVVDY